MNHLMGHPIFDHIRVCNRFSIQVQTSKAPDTPVWYVCTLKEALTYANLYPQGNYLHTLPASWQDRITVHCAILTQKIVNKIEDEIGAWRMDHGQLYIGKGQLISKCPFGFIVWTKIPTKNLTNFCPRI